MTGALTACAVATPASAISYWKRTVLVPKADGDADKVSYKRAFVAEQKRLVGQELDGFAVSLKRFGAIGDGTADNTAAILAAFNDGRSIRLPSHLFELRSGTSSLATVPKSTLATPPRAQCPSMVR
jgi:hypothetical protein